MQFTEMRKPLIGQINEKVNNLAKWQGAMQVEMEREANGLWDYAERWQRIFTAIRELRWEGNWLANDYCRDCRFCCGKQDSDYPFPMPLLEKQKRPGLDQDFHLLDELTPFLDSRGCKSLGATGCKRKYEEKPIACGLFPIVLANGHLYLYQECPAVLYTPLARFLELGREAAQMLLELDFAELRRLSLWLMPDVLAESYISLHIRLFDRQGKSALLT